jgi:hypothetical protein
VHQASVQALKMRNAVEGISPRWGEKDFVGDSDPEVARETRLPRAFFFRASGVVQTSLVTRSLLLPVLIGFAQKVEGLALTSLSPRSG